MEDVRTILMPYDGTEGSESALTEGAKLCKIFDSKMIILFVIEDKFFSKPYIQKIIPSSESTNKVFHIINNTISGLMEKKVSYFEERGVKTSYIVERGYPTEIILKTAKESQADLIVMGRKGLRGIEKLKTIGSVSRKVAENIDIPVVLVSHTNDKEYDKILVPYDVEDPSLSQKSLEAALKIRNKNDIQKVKITVFHIVPEFIVPSSVSGVQLKSRISGEVVTAEQYFKELYHEVKDEAYRFIKSNINTDLGIDIEVSYGNPADKIIEYVSKNNIGFVVMGTNTLHGISKITSLGSVTRRVAESIDCPIMLVK